MVGRSSPMRVPPGHGWSRLAWPRTFDRSNRCCTVLTRQVAVVNHLTRGGVLAHLQPALHDLDLCVRAPTAVASDHTGQLLGSRGHGVLHADVRVLSRAELVVDGTDLELIRAVRDGSSRSRFVSLARSLGDPGPDTTIRVG